ncbi:hypothetical protein Hanom_Chr16g01474121 [Helianthus anomalus]
MNQEPEQRRLRYNKKRNFQEESVSRVSTYRIRLCCTRMVSFNKTNETNLKCSGFL